MFNSRLLYPQSELLAVTYWPNKIHSKYIRIELVANRRIEFFPLVNFEK